MYLLLIVKQHGAGSKVNDPSGCNSEMFSYSLVGWWFLATFVKSISFYLCNVKVEGDMI